MMKVERSKYVVALAALLTTISFAAAHIQTSHNVRSLEYIPRDAMAVMHIDVRSLSEDSRVGAALKTLVNGPSPVRGLSISDIEAVTIAVLAGAENGDFVAKLQVAPERLQEFISKTAGEAEEVVIDGKQVYHSRYQAAVMAIDGSTLLLASSPQAISRSLLTRSAESTSWAEDWKNNTAPITAMLNSKLLRGSPQVEGMAYEAMRELSRRPSSLPTRVNRLWTESEQIQIWVTTSPEISMRILAKSGSQDAAQQVNAAVADTASLARNGLSLLRHHLAAQSNARGFMPLIDSVDQAIETARIETQGNQTAALVSLGEQGNNTLLSYVANAVGAASKAQFRSSEMNRFKQLALAMHNYESAYKRFPAAIQKGPGDTPRSWRVTLLPFLEEAPLYQRYQQDKPWDSPENAELVKEIPEVLQGTDMPRGKTDAFCFYGRGALFDPESYTQFRDITDGTSNTIMFVQWKHGQPWSKPWDIPFDQDIPLDPELLNGELIVATADGAVHHLTKRRSETDMKNAIMRSDGNLVNLFRRER